jgi:hypothetical protein
METVQYFEFIGISTNFKDADLPEFSCPRVMQDNDGRLRFRK